MINLKAPYSDSAVVTQHKLIGMFGKWRLYEVTFLTKKAKLLVDHEIQGRYSNLKRLTDNFFVGLEKYES